MKINMKNWVVVVENKTFIFEPMKNEFAPV